MSIRYSRILAGLLATTMVAGCSVSHESASGIRVASNEAGGLMATAARPMQAKDNRTVKVNDGVFVGNKSIRNENGEPLPSRFEGKSGVTIVRTSPSSLREIAAAVTEYTKIPVVLSASPVSGSQPAAPAPAAAGPGGLAAGPIPDGFPIQDALNQISGSQAGPIVASGSGVSASEIPLNYSGSLSGLLDIVASHFNVAWKYERGRIVLDTVVTRSFDIPALAITSNLAFDLSSKSTGSDTANSAGQTASAKADSDVYSEINTGLQGLVGEGSFSINKTTGVVTVTSTPATVARVADYVTSMNQRLGEQVAVSVKVYSVSLKDGEDFDLNVAGVFNEAGKYGLNFGNAAGGVVPAVAGGAGPGLGWALLDNASKLKGSNALVNALSTRGDVSVVTTASVTTVNGVPVPLQVGEERDYVKQVTTTAATSDTAATTSVEPGTVSTGFSLQLTPRVERNGDILLQYGINISELTGSEDGFDTYTSPDNSTKIQLRRVSQRNFIQQARIPSNNTLVLAGFEQVRNETTKRGVGRANFPLFGGGSAASMKREIIVIAITPTLLKAH